MEVVGTMFFEDKKLLIDKPRNRPTFQMIGGRVEEGESVKEAAIRECYEELGDDVVLDEGLFQYVMDFDEIATSDQKTPIHFTVYQYMGALEGEINTSSEIEDFLWYDTSFDEDILSNTLKNEVIPYCVKNTLIR